MKKIPDDIEAILRTVAQLYAIQGKRTEVEILAKSKAEVFESAYDNWNGGTFGYTLVIRVPISVYAKIETTKNAYQEDIKKRIEPILIGYHNQSLDAVDINMEIENDQNWRENATKWLEKKPANINAESAKYDIFISHASEDKEDLVRPLATALKKAKYTVWYDEYELTVGDNLSQSIDKGLSRSNYGLVVFSPSFFKKSWPRYELDGLVSRQMVGNKVILPIWHKISRKEILSYSPPLADKLALSTDVHDIESMVKELSKVLGKK